MIFFLVCIAYILVCARIFGCVSVHLYTLKVKAAAVYRIQQEPTRSETPFAKNMISIIFHDSGPQRSQSVARRRMSYEYHSKNFQRG